MRVVWFRNDLRVHDHQALYDAVKSGEKVQGVYIWDKRFEAEQTPGLKRMGQHRQRFLEESLEDLKQSLSILGIDLVELRGKGSKLLPEWLQEQSVRDVYVHTHPGVEESQELAMVQESSPQVRWHIKEGHMLLRKDQLAMDLSEFPMSFTQFRKKLEKALQIPQKNSAYHSVEREVIKEAPVPDWIKKQLNADNNRAYSAKSKRENLGTDPVKGGETAALKRLETYVGQADRLFSYKETRDGMLSFDDSSKLSFWLASGCLSPKRVYQRILDMESQSKRNESSYWLFFELLWREYFQWLLVATGSRLFELRGLLDYERQWSHNNEYFDAWKNGQTGYPLVDAAMTELKKTGYMSNRSRQNTASFLTKNLGVNWLWGARYFEEQLIDFDTASNYGNWAYQAGVGTDTREMRAFNVINQGIRYDPKGLYVKHWLGLPSDLPGKTVYDPYALMKKTDWHKPIVEQTRSLEARKKEWGLR
ncbi:Cryptochrome [Alkalibacterium sp. AK22]|uniref:DASH family cryptochrome n=1 Tax=Alkalibacterium sp. AK22 TaxID=1229520 RepID=UPI0004456E0E|nr:DASH family cryptochrome [Alkalibacterium sp. AK22]EXJ22968.1 Cryptochrome [Alkalibacterium sp. AK22]